MRYTHFKEGDIVHCIHRGAMGGEIFRDTSDRWRFIRLAYLCNDHYRDTNTHRIENTTAVFHRPSNWPPRNELVDILAFVVMPNHFHLLLREKTIGGIGKFMQRLSGSVTMGFNKKYGNRGTIFQSKYKPVLVTSDEHLSRLISYINVKNVCELYPEGGLSGAIKDFEKAYAWAKTYPFSSLLNWTDGSNSPLLCMDEIARSVRGEGVIRTHPSENAFKDFSLQMLKVVLEKQRLGEDEMKALLD